MKRARCCTETVTATYPRDVRMAHSSRDFRFVTPRGVIAGGPGGVYRSEDGEQMDRTDVLARNMKPARPISCMPTGWADTIASRAGRTYSILDPHRAGPRHLPVRLYDTRT